MKIGLRKVNENDKYVNELILNVKIEELIELIKAGESERIEFKSSVSSDVGEAICALANTEGGYLLIGVSDDGRIVGAKERDLERISSFILNILPKPSLKIERVYVDDKLVIVINVEKSDKLHTIGGRAYIRIGRKKRPLELEEIAEKLIESLVIKFDELKSSYRAEVLSEELFREYLERRSRARMQRFKGDLSTLMERMRAVVRVDGELYATNAGILFFTEEPKRYLPQAVVRVVVFSDEARREYLDHKEFSLPLWKLVDALEEYFIRVLPRFGGRVAGFRRIDVVQYPIEALREGIINALIHRNYFSSADVRIFVFPSKIQIINPGSFPPGVTPENPIHKPRNPILAEYMYGLGYVEKYGVGIERMREVCEKRGIKITYTLQTFQTTLEFSLPRAESIKLDDLDLEILNLIKGGVNRASEIARALGMSKVAVLKRIKKLELINLVKRTGKGRKTAYEAC